MLLVTGASGLVGTELVHQLLRAGRPVKAVINNKDFHYSHPLLIKVKADILDVVTLEEAMQGVQAVFHCAALISFDPAQAMKMHKVNVEGTANVVNAALAKGVKRLVHVSSVAALERMREDCTVDETTSYIEGNGGSAYGYSKYLAEMEVFRGIEEGLPASMVNPSIILGPGELDGFSTKLFSTVYKGFPWYTEGTTGFVDVRDVARAMILLMDSGVTGEKFILSAQNASFKRVFEMIAKYLQKKSPYIKINPLVSSLYWRVEKIRSLITGKEPLITRETARSAHVRVTFDNRKFLNQFPSFSYTPLEKTIEETCLVLKPRLEGKI